MSRISRTSPVGALTRAALVPPAAVAVHQLRYLLAYRGGAGAALEATGHSYLHSVAPWIIGLLGLAAGGFLWALGQAMAGRRTRAWRPASSLTVLWLLCTGVLAGIFVGQELLEGFLLTGHPGGLAGVLGHGGWWALPVAACLGLVLAAVFHGAARVLDVVAARRRPPLGPAPRRWVAPRAPGGRVARPVPLAAGWSDRGPPAA